MTKTLYEGGGIEVESTDYVHFRDEDEMEEEPQTEEEEYEPIPGLDDVVSSARALRFELDYPFEKPYAGEVVGESGITLRRIIDAIRTGYSEMYTGSTQEDIPNLVNKMVEGKYGKAYHVIGDLVIESIELDEENGLLEVFVGS